MKTHTAENTESLRGKQLERLIRLAQFLRGQSKPMRLDKITEKLNAKANTNWHERTIRRDLLLLQAVKAVHCDRSHHAWTWKIAGGLFDLPAAKVGKARDAHVQPRKDGGPCT